MTDEWIEHDGLGWPPLERDTVVQVRFADGTESLAQNPWTVQQWSVNWGHEFISCSADIVAYKVVGSC